MPISINQVIKSFPVGISILSESFQTGLFRYPSYLAFVVLANIINYIAMLFPFHPLALRIFINRIWLIFQFYSL